MDVNTHQLTRHALNWAVAKAEGLKIIGPDSEWESAFKGGRHYERNNEPWPIPSFYADWCKAGPIIEREKIDLVYVRDHKIWTADISSDAGYGLADGETALLAAMRCFVASRLGPTINIPEELAC